MITIHKADPNGAIVTSYRAWLLHDHNYVLALARWQRPTVVTSYASFALGDLLFELFFEDRPYNIFALTDGAQLPPDLSPGPLDTQGGVAPAAAPEAVIERVRAQLPAPTPLKGYYVNFTHPAVFDRANHTLVWRDLHLDLWLPAHGEPILLDEDEYRALALPDSAPDLARAIEDALDTLTAQARTRTGPFSLRP